MPSNPTSDQKTEQKADEKSAKKPDVTIVRDFEALTTDAFVVPPITKIIDEEKQLSVIYQSAHTLDVKDEGFEVQLQQLLQNFIQWAKTNHCRFLDIDELNARLEEYRTSNKHQLAYAKAFFEKIYLYLCNAEIPIAKRKAFWHRFREETAYCGPGTYKKLENLAKLISNQNNSIDHWLHELREQLIDDFCTLYLHKVPTSFNAKQSSHILLAFANYAHQMQWGIVRTHDQYSHLINIAAEYYEQFHGGFLRDYQPHLILDTIIKACHPRIMQLVAAEGLEVAAVKNITCFENEIKFLKKALERVLEKYNLSPAHIINIIATIQGPIPEKYEENLTRALTGVIPQTISADAKLTENPTKHLTAAITALKECQLTQAQIGVLSQGLLPNDAKAKESLKNKCGIDEQWLAFLNDKDNEYLWSIYNSRELVNRLNDFSAVLADLFKGIGFNTAPDKRKFFHPETLQYRADNLRAILLQLIYKENKLFNPNAWQVIELHKDNKLYLFYSSTNTTDTRLFWLEDASDNPLSFYFYLGIGATKQFEKLLTQIKNPQNILDVIKAIICSTNGATIRVLAPILITHLTNTELLKILSPISLGRFVFILIQQKCWKEALQVLQLNINIALNSYCCPETGDFALHLATRAGQTELVQALCKKGANPLFVNKKPHGAEKPPQTPLELTISDSKNEQKIAIGRELLKTVSNLTPAQRGMALAQNADHNHWSLVSSSEIDFDQFSLFSRKTALQTAVVLANSEAVRKLCENRANTSLVGGFSNKSSLQFAMHNYDSTSAAHLIQNSSIKSLNQYDIGFLNDLLVLLIHNYTEHSAKAILALLTNVNAPLDLTKKRKKDKLPFYKAICTIPHSEYKLYILEKIISFLKQGYTRYKFDAKGDDLAIFTLHLAANNYWNQALDLLSINKILNLCYCEGDRIQHLAAKARRFDVLLILLQNGFDFYAPQQKAPKQSSFQIACELNPKATRNLFLSHPQLKPTLQPEHRQLLLADLIKDRNWPELAEYSIAFDRSKNTLKPDQKSNDEKSLNLSNNFDFSAQVACDLSIKNIEGLINFLSSPVIKINLLLKNRNHTPLWRIVLESLKPSTPEAVKIVIKTIIKNFIGNICSYYECNTDPSNFHAFISTLAANNYWDEMHTLLSYRSILGEGPITAVLGVILNETAKSKPNKQKWLDLIDLLQKSSCFAEKIQKTIGDEKRQESNTLTNKFILFLANYKQWPALLSFLQDMEIKSIDFNQKNTTDVTLWELIANSPKTQITSQIIGRFIDIILNQPGQTISNINLYIFDLCNMGYWDEANRLLQPNIALNFDHHSVATGNHIQHLAAQANRFDILHKLCDLGADLHVYQTKPLKSSTTLSSLKTAFQIGCENNPQEMRKIILAFPHISLCLDDKNLIILLADYVQEKKWKQIIIFLQQIQHTIYKCKSAENLEQKSTSDEKQELAPHELTTIVLFLLKGDYSSELLELLKTNTNPIDLSHIDDNSIPLWTSVFYLSKHRATEKTLDEFISRIKIGTAQISHDDLGGLLCYMAERGYWQQVLNFLQIKNMQLNWSFYNYSGDYIQHIAAKAKRFDILRLLFKNNINLHLQQADVGKQITRQTAIELAIKADPSATHELLRENPILTNSLSPQHIESIFEKMLPSMLAKLKAGIIQSLIAYNDKLNPANYLSALFIPDEDVAKLSSVPGDKFNNNIFQKLTSNSAVTKPSLLSGDIFEDSVLPVVADEKNTSESSTIDAFAEREIIDNIKLASEDEKYCNGILKQIKSELPAEVAIQENLLETVKQCYVKEILMEKRKLILTLNNTSDHDQKAVDFEQHILISKLINQQSAVKKDRPSHGLFFERAYPQTSSATNTAMQPTIDSANGFISIETAGLASAAGLSAAGGLATGLTSAMTNTNVMGNITAIAVPADTTRPVSLTSLPNLLSDTVVDAPLLPPPRPQL